MQNSQILFDWDGTVFPDFTILPWAKFLFTRGFFSEKDLTQLEDVFNQYLHNDIGYEQLCSSSAAIYATLIAGKKESIISYVAIDFANAMRKKIFPYVQKVFEYFRTNEAKLIVISGAPTPVLQAFSREIRFDKIYGLEIDVDYGGFLIDNVVQNPGLSVEKEKCVRLATQGFRVPYAFGNSLSDLPLFRAAERGVLINNSIDLFPSDVQRKLISICSEGADAIMFETQYSIATS